MHNQWIAKVVSYETGEVVKFLSAPTRSHAERLEAGLNINLDHDKYYTKVVPHRPVSPCISQCSKTPEGVCGGCSRTYDEIRRWKDMNADERETVWQRLEAAPAASR